jgi:hypothetical protein
MSAPHFDWVHALDTLFNQVWTRLARGVHDRHAPARHPTLGTVSPDGMPQLRTVVLRAVDKDNATLRVYTDLHSAKVAELRASPVAALHVWDSSAHLQTRVSGQVTVLTGSDVAPIWDTLPDHGRMAYGSNPAPGTPIPTSLDYAKLPDPAAFAVLHLVVTMIDVVHLGPDHRRARFSRADAWAGEWLAP